MRENNRMETKPARACGLRLAPLIVLGLAGSTRAQVDGVITNAEYGPPIATQTNGTGFGDNQNELDALYARKNLDGSLQVGITGNLQQGGNGLVLFIDSRSGGGVNSVLPGGYGVLGSIPGRTVDDWGTDTDGSAGVAPTPGGGAVLPPGFNPDFAIELNNNSPDWLTYYVNVIDLTLVNDPPLDPLDPDNRDIYLGSNIIGPTSITQTYFRDNGSTDAGHIEHAFDNSNTAGVTDDGALAGDPLTATTGMEFLFSADFLNADLPDASLMAFITSGGGDFVSNQFLPGLPEGWHNLGGAEPGAPMFDAPNTPGYSAVLTPEPSSLAVLSLGAIALLRRRR